MRTIINSPTEDCALLGQQLRRLRLARNIAQSELAKRAGVSFSVVRRLEAHGRGSLEAWVKLLYALGQAERLATWMTAPEPISIAELAQQAKKRTRASRKASTAFSPLP